MILYGSQIRICNCDVTLKKILQQKLTFDNPEYYRKQALGKYVGNVQSKIILWQRDGDDIIVPYGMKKFIDKWAERNNIDRRTLPALVKNDQPFRYGSRITPYEYQEKAIQASIEAEHGIIIAPCGSGKTQIALEICARLGLKALWLTHTRELLKQSKDRAEANFVGLEKGDFGTITNGKIDIGKVITFATIQTMAKIDLNKVSGVWDVVIVDECHRAVGSPTKLTMFWKVVSSLCARYKFGLTATPERADGLTPCMYALLGGKIYEVSKEEVESNTCPIRVEMMFTKFDPSVDKFIGTDGIIDYNKLQNVVTGDENRNAIILDDVKTCTKPCLVLTDRVAHAKLLFEGAGDKARLLVGESNKTNRDAALEDIKTGKAEVLVATYPIAKEGLDVPDLRTVILATPTKNEATVIQSCGRVGRKAYGKDVGVVYDYVDDAKILYRMSLSRTKIYEKQGYDVAFRHRQ